MESPNLQSSPVFNLIEDKMKEQLLSFETSTKNVEYKLVETVSVSHNLKLEEAIERIVSLEQKQGEMLRLHAAMYDLVRDLAGVVSTNVAHSSLLSPASSPPPLLLHTERKEQQQASLPSYLPSGQSTFLHTKQELFEDTESKEQLCFSTKEGREEHTSCTRKDTGDTERKKQQQHIE